MEKYFNGIGFCAGIFMLKWNVFANYLTDLKLESGSKINLFINFESILENICNFKRFNNLMSFYKQKVVIEFESAVLNLLAHYRGFFKKNNYNGNIYLYCTGLNDLNQSMKKINKWYRNYYFNKYTRNPEYKNIKSLYDIAVNDLKLIIKFIPNCFIIESNGCDGSMIPKLFEDSNNVIITKDLFDTIYLFENFKVLFIKQSYRKNINECIFTDPINILSNELDPSINICKTNIFTSEMYYKILLSFIGNHYRNIDDLNSDTIKTKDFVELLNTKILSEELLMDFKSIESAIKSIPKKIQNSLMNNFKCFDFNNHLSLMTENNIDNIKTQAITEYDLESIQALNNQRFLEFPVSIIDLI